MPNFQFHRVIALLVAASALITLLGCSYTVQRPPDPALGTPGYGRFVRDEYLADHYMLVMGYYSPLPGTEPNLPNDMVRLSFDGDRFTVSTPCAQIEGDYEVLSDGHIDFSNIESLKLDCSSDLENVVDMRFSSILRDKPRFEIKYGELTLFADSGLKVAFDMAGKPTSPLSYDIDVAPQLVECREGSRDALWVRKTGENDAWRIWTKGIKSFYFHPGTNYRLRVIEEIGGTMTDPYLDDIHWTLERVISTHKSAGADAKLERVDCTQR